MASKGVKAIQDKLDTEITAHTKTTKELNKEKGEVGRSEGIITALLEAAQKKGQWYHEQIEIECQMKREVKV